MIISCLHTIFKIIICLISPRIIYGRSMSDKSDNLTKYAKSKIHRLKNSGPSK